MSRYTYAAVRQNNQLVQGTEAAATPDLVRSALEERGLMVLRIRPVSSRRRTGSSRGQVLQFTRSIAPLLKSGLTLFQALAATETLARADFRPTVQDICARIERGESLKQSLAQHGHVFDTLYVAMVGAGEASGDLTGAFEHLAHHLEREAEVRGRLGAALLYPMLLATTGIVTLLVIFLFVLPGFAETIEQTGTELPWLASALMVASDHVRSTGAGVTIAVAALCLIATVAWTRAKRGYLLISRAALRLPWVGRIRRYILGARFARSVGVLLTGGAPLLTALRGSDEVTGDGSARAEIRTMIADIEAGSSMRAALANGTVWPPVLCELAAVGERSGALAPFMLRAADLLDEAAERSLNTAVRFLEPAMILMIGGIVGFVALALLQAVHGVSAGVLP